MGLWLIDVTNKEKPEKYKLKVMVQNTIKLVSSFFNFSTVSNLGHAASQGLFPLMKQLTAYGLPLLTFKKAIDKIKNIF